MRMTPEAFHTWSQHLGLSPEAEALIASIRSSRPVRRVSGRAGNITGRYPSPKMGERDEDVLEFYGQPSRIPLSYRAKSGRRTTQWHTPDFFVLRRESAGWEEWKPADSLDRLATEKPARYQQAGTGQWRCPPGEVYAGQLGLTYRLRSSAEFHPLEIQNLKFLQDFWAHEVPPRENGTGTWEHAWSAACWLGRRDRETCLCDTPNAASCSQTQQTSCESACSRT